MITVLEVGDRVRMKARSSSSVVVAVVVVMLQCCYMEVVQCANNYTVGVGFTDDANTSWTNTVNGLVKPAALEAAFQPWADSVNVTVGDTLAFDYRRGEHSVFLAKSEEAYKECNFSLGSAEIITDGAYAIKQGDGTLFFTCPIPGHCESGQKVTITPFGNTNSTSTIPSTPSSSDTSQHSKLIIKTMTLCILLVILTLSGIRI